MLYAPPERLSAEVFARIPDRYRKTGRTSPWAEAHRPGVPTDCFIEGPSFDRAGNLYVVDIPWGRIFQVAPDGQVALYAEYDGQPNGLKIHRDGRMFIADFRRGLMVLDPHTRDVSPVLAAGPDGPFRGLNDLVFASNGDLYFTDQGMTGLHDPSGSLYRLTADGRLDRLLANIPSPNGLVLDAAERAVYVNVTRGNAVWRVPLSSEGWPYKVGIHIQLSGGMGGPDGLAINEEGGLAVAHVGLGAVWVFTPLAEPLYRIDCAEGQATTNLAYGGAQRRDLYITESDSGCILRCTLPTPGRAMYSHQ